MKRESNGWGRMVVALGAMAWAGSGLAGPGPVADASPAKAALAEEELESVEVVGVAPVHGVGLAREKVPTNIQTMTGKDINRGEPIDLTDAMNRNLGNVTINAAQNNPLQPDFNYRGFSASPLLGLPQGISVFVNGARYNDPFGDTVNWDLLPQSAIKSLNVVGGSNPVFGLNTLGGAITLETKNGFNSVGHSAEVFGGSFGRSVVTVESGDNNGDFGYFFNLRNFNENGWRDYSPSQDLNIYSSVGWHPSDSQVDLSVFWGQSDLYGNGPVPVELLNEDRRAFFTAPDRTQNDMTFVTLEGSHWFNDELQYSGNAYYRNTSTRSFNGDVTPWVDCSGAGALFSGRSHPAYPLFPNEQEFWGYLAANGISREEDEPGDCPDEISKLANTPGLAAQVLTDQYGNPVGYNDPDAPLNAINNRSHRRQQSFGTTQQVTVLYDLFGFKNQFLAGMAYNRGLVNFNSAVEVGYLQPTRISQGIGLYIPDEGTVMSGSTMTWSGYFNDALDLTDTVTLNVGGRFNSTTVINQDDLGNAPELNSQSTYSRFNPAAGLTWQALEWLNLYGSYSESARAPTIIELACSDPEVSCRLPNAFLSDPPLKQVVAETFEAGARGTAGKDINWNLGFYDTLNRDDILFQTTGGAQSNYGYFANVGSTRRLGVEAGIAGTVLEDWRWYANYGFIDATFRSDFTVSSPYNPARIESFGPNNQYRAVIPVQKGDHIPGIPQNNLKIGLEVPLFKVASIGMQGIFNSGQYLRGDEGNYMDQTDPYFVLNLYGSYRFHPKVTGFFTIQNLTNAGYETFGTLGQANEVPSLGNFTDPRFLGPAPPFGGWVGFRINL